MRMYELRQDLIRDEEAVIAQQVAEPLTVIDLHIYKMVFERIARKSQFRYQRCIWALSKNYARAQLRDSAIMAMGYRIAKTATVERTQYGVPYI
jgi:hypothetical protein